MQYIFYNTEIMPFEVCSIIQTCSVLIFLDSVFYYLIQIYYQYQMNALKQLIPSFKMESNEIIPLISSSAQQRCIVKIKTPTKMCNISLKIMFL